jgi:hypothetical protein
MARLPQEIADFMEKYGVTSDEIWLVAGGKNYAVKHDALERVASENGITFDVPTVTQNEKDAVAIWVRVRKDDWSDWTFGEASDANSKNKYFWAMAEKRARDRGTLKALKVYDLIKSEEEADDWKQPQQRENPHVTRPEDISDGKPNGEIPHVEGVTALPKAKSRETFAELEAEMIRLQTLPGLMAWGKTIAATVATMHPDFQDTFRRRFAEYRDELKAMAEAAE